MFYEVDLVFYELMVFHEEVFCYHTFFVVSYSDVWSLRDVLYIYLSLYMRSLTRSIYFLFFVSEDAETNEARELRELKESLEATPPVGPLVAGAKTLDQVRSVP